MKRQLIPFHGICHSLYALSQWKEWITSFEDECYVCQIVDDMMIFYFLFLKVWTGKGSILHLIQEIREHAKAVTSLAVLQPGEKLYSGSLDRTARVRCSYNSLY